MRAGPGAAAVAERLPDPATGAGQGVTDASAWDDATLVAAARREDPHAFAELYDRFVPRLVRLARAWRVPVGEREPLAAEVVGDVALALVRHAAAPPRSLAAYLATALRHRIGAAARLRARHGGLVALQDVSSEPGRFAPPSRDPEHSDAVTLLLCSQHARRSADPAWSAAVLDPALVRLAEHLLDGVSPDDRRLLAWLAEDVPLRTAADWLGLRYDTAVKRAQRLRARLRERAARYPSTLADGRERRAVEAFLRRAGAGASPGASPTASASLSPGPCPGTPQETEP